jgi:hypothetical protein
LEEVQRVLAAPERPPLAIGTKVSFGTCSGVVVGDVAAGTDFAKVLQGLARTFAYCSNMQRVSELPRVFIDAGVKANPRLRVAHPDQVTPLEPSHDPHHQPLG